MERDGIIMRDGNVLLTLAKIQYKSFGIKRTGLHAEKYMWSIMAQEIQGKEEHHTFSLKYIIFPVYKWNLKAIDNEH